MALSTDSTLRELIADEKAKAVLLAHHPDLVNDPQMEQAMDISIRQIAEYSGGSLTDESLKEMDDDLSKL